MSLNSDWKKKNSGKLLPPNPTFTDFPGSSRTDEKRLTLIKATALTY